MTFDRDPPRWTSAPEQAPEELRAPLRAAAGEGPSSLQMKSLALKLAAISAGTAVAASAATAKAAATTAGGASAKAAGALTLGKTLASLAIVGVVGTSAVLWQRSEEPRPSHTQPVAQQPLQAPAPARPVPAVQKPALQGHSEPGFAPVVEPLAPEAHDVSVERAAEEPREEQPTRTNEAPRARTRKAPAGSRAVEGKSDGVRSARRDEPKRTATSE